MANYYELLEISPLASTLEIKSAFKAMAIKYHPDKHAGDLEMEERFKLVNEAYQILSNSYKRSNYDMLLRYGHSRSEFSSDSNSHPRPASAPRTFKPQISNLRATFYAFSIAFSFAGVIVTAMYISNIYETMQRTELLMARRVVFDQAKEAHAQGDQGKSLELLSSIGSFHNEENDMREFKDQLLLDIRAIGDDFMLKGLFEKAIHHYDLLNHHSISQTIDFLKNKAFAYKEIGHVDKALEIYQTMHLHGYQTSSFYYEIGVLYEEGMGDFGRALNYYEIGAEMAAAEYEVTIGKAYPIVINAGMIPPIHYDIYMSVAEAHLALGQFEKAITAVSWTKEIWSDSLLNYSIEAKGYAALGDRGAMKKSIEEAKQIDPEFSLN